MIGRWLAELRAWWRRCGAQEPYDGRATCTLERFHNGLHHDHREYRIGPNASTWYSWR